MKSARLALLLAMLAAFGMNAYFNLLVPRAHRQLASEGLFGPHSIWSDLYPYWLGARYVVYRQGDPYSHGYTITNQIASYGRPLHPNAERRTLDERRFMYPAYVCLLLAPIAPIPFPWVMGGSIVVLTLLTAMSVFWWARAVGLQFSPGYRAVAVILAVSSYPFLDGLYVQQMAFVVAALLAGAAAAVTGGRYGLAGICLAVATIKPHTAAPLVALLMIWTLGDWRTRRRLALTFLATLAILWVAAEIAVPGWLFGWLSNLTAWRQYTPLPLARTLFGEIPGRVVEIALLLAAALMAWQTRREAADSPRFVTTLLFVLAAAIIVFPNGLAAYDHVLLIPVALWLAHHARELLQAGGAVRWLLVLAGALLAWQWVTALVVALVALALPAGREVGLLLLSLPIRTVIAFPFVLTALMAVLVRRGWMPPRQPS